MKKQKQKAKETQMDNWPTLEDQIACLRREWYLRNNVYPKWVESGKMTKQVAERELETLAAAISTLKGLEKKT